MKEFINNQPIIFLLVIWLIIGFVSTSVKYITHYQEGACVDDAFFKIEIK